MQTVFARATGESSLSVKARRRQTNPNDLTRKLADLLEENRQLKAAILIYQEIARRTGQTHP